MPTDAHPPLQSHLTLAQLTREQRLQVIVRKGLPPFRQTALELAKALGGESPDLKKASKLISTDPALSSQLLQMCNSPLLGMHSRVISIDHAAILLGPERLRSLALTTSVADFVGKALPEAQMNAFWQHSFMTATLSQYLAERWKYFEKYQAYIAGLLHDIGQIPEWMLLSEGTGEADAPPSDWVDNSCIEQEYFGTDHCKLGVIMARSWGLMPSFIDVLENHHTPELAQRDSVLVRVVATADCFLSTKGESLSSLASGHFVEEEHQRLVQLGQGLFGESKWPQVKEALEQEYARVLPIANAGLKGLLNGDTEDSERDSDSFSRLASQIDRDAGPILRQGLPQPKSAHVQTGARTVRSGSILSMFLSRCKSFIQKLR